ncbi:MAG TPA: hypothetical protein VJ624_07540 [Thermodesulfobacteriota bacterium]|nr:hypothetical protein [Thermodesulfobacteriota bacterium]
MKKIRVKIIVVVESPYKWKTTFDFKNEDGQWLIIGYCVYQ